VLETMNVTEKPLPDALLEFFITPKRVEDINNK
jgi:hypothetical protein